MQGFRIVAIGLAGFMALTACTDVALTANNDAASASGDVSRLRAFGFKVSARDDAGQPAAMSYTGPITAAVVCGPAKGPFAPLKPAMTDLDGAQKRASLDAYMILADGKVSTGIYAIVLHGKGKAPEGIDFKPGEAKSFKSGLTCKAA